ncbi:MAG: ribosome biogenesis GTPase Der [Candidatus Tectomicrobia bacterium]|nr:ribosome biogenesis GTPase Der [Candidatus Tectomicrobia bacterium]
MTPPPTEQPAQDAAPQPTPPAPSARARRARPRALPVVAIIGRPNVGKSTLFNRIIQRRQAIVEPTPGVTRDRNYAIAEWHGRQFQLVDTGGFEPTATETLLAQVREQARLAIDEADLLLFLGDARSGLTPMDEEIIAELRRSDKPLLAAINKVEGPSQETAAAEFYRLGLSPMLPVSAEHGRGVGDLLDAVLALLPRAPTQEVVEPEVRHRICVLGRPNVGKSSLINYLLRQPRHLVDHRPGTTHDAIDTIIRYHGLEYLFIDTAGIRRKGRVSQAVEKFSVVMALKSLRRADIALLMIDAVEGVTDQDATIAGYVHEAGKACIVLVNKWDSIERDTHTFRGYVDTVREHLKFFPDAPVLTISAKTGQRVMKIFAAIERVGAAHEKLVPTPVLNDVLHAALQRHPLPVPRGQPVRFYYATQCDVRPPTFILFVNNPKGVHFSSTRYVVNQIREAFGFVGTPLRVIWRRSRSAKR